MGISDILKQIACSLRVALREQRRLDTFRQNFLIKGARLQDGRFSCLWEDRWPCLDDATQNTSFDTHYVYHTAWAARRLAKNPPARHVDIGSCLRFATLASAFVPLDFYDYRPAELALSNLTSRHANLLSLPFADNSITSLSCMHVVEHIGLERYGDLFDPQGDLKAIRELRRVLAPGGRLLFVVPIGGTARIQYNAHRIYSYPMVLEAFAGLSVENFSLVTDTGTFIDGAEPEDAARQRYGCGCFALFKQPGEESAGMPKDDACYRKY